MHVVRVHRSPNRQCYLPYKQDALSGLLGWLEAVLSFILLLANFLGKITFFLLLLRLLLLPLTIQALNFYSENYLFIDIFFPFPFPFPFTPEIP